MTHQFPLIVCLIPVIIAAIPAVAGLVMVFCRLKIGWLVVAFGLGLGVLIGPMLFADRLTISDMGVQHRTGFWFNPRIYGLTFADVSSISIQTEEDRDGRPEQIWCIRDSTGAEERVDPGDLWVLKREHVIAACAGHGIEVQDLTNPR